MISWRSARLFLLYLTTMAVFVVMIAGVSDLNLTSLLASFQQPEAQSTPPPAGGAGVSKIAPRLPAGQAGPFVYPMVVIPKDAPSIFEEV